MWRSKLVRDSASEFRETIFPSTGRDLGEERRAATKIDLQLVNMHTYGPAQALFYGSGTSYFLKFLLIVS
jgi:hypothetical protein